MVPINRPRPYSTWVHVKSGGTYTVLGVSRDSTNGPGEGKECVVYLSHAYQALRHRGLQEFTDGRFVELIAKE